MCQASRRVMNKAQRLERLLPNGRGVWIPIDHGMSDYPSAGLEDTEGLIRELASAGVNAIVAQKGVVSHYSHLCEGTNTNMVIHFSASTRHGGPDASPFSDHRGYTNFSAHTLCQLPTYTQT